MLQQAQSFDSSINASDFNSLFVSPPGNIMIKTAGAFNANYLAQNGDYYQMSFTQTFPVIKPGITGFTGFRYRTQTYGRDNVFRMMITDINGNGHICLTVSSAGQPTIWQMNGGNQNTALFTGAIGQIPSGWCFLELGWLVSQTVGTVELKLNTQTIFKGTGLATQGLGTVDAASYARNFYGAANLQDMYVSDSTGPAPGNTFLGDLRVLEVPPTGAGSSTSFTPTGAPTNWQVAAQTPPTPATIFNSSNVVGALDLYTIAAMPTGLGVIFGVQVTGLLNKTDPGLRIAGLAIKSGATLAVGSGHSVQVGPTIYSDVFSVDPATGVAFIPSGVNALQFGPTIIS